MKLITVFTPTYNRAYCLPQVYDSLLNQTSKNFTWLIIDDGSSDTTRELVNGWINDGKIQIEYTYQENQGMHGAHNTAYTNIQTILNVCCDSDDSMPSDAISIIESKWEEVSDNKGIAGMVGLDIFKSGKIVGSAFPNELKYSTLDDIYNIHQARGDKKLVLITEIVKKYPRYPLFEGERFVPLGILYLQIDQDYKLACINKPLCIVEYLPDGSSLNIFKQYKKNPKGFRHSRKEELRYTQLGIGAVKKMLHLISSTLFIGDNQYLKDNPFRVLTTLLIPLGLVFHVYILYKIHR